MKRLGKGPASLLAAMLAVSIAARADAQPREPREGEPRHFTLDTHRHGPSFFKINYLKETTPLVEGEWDFKHYHLYDEMVYWMKRWAAEHPNLVDVYVGGISLEGREIMQLTLTNKETGPDTDKPAMMIDAMRHAGEVTAGESTLWMMHHMIENYGRDEEITRLIDNFAFYFRPSNNPDGNLLYLMTAQTLRSTVRPMDNDGDGLLDEDPLDDLDGDGFSRQMRVRRPAGEGTMIPDPRDARLMIRAPQGEGIYDVMAEGIDNDGDGRVNEDGVGGLDLHRNYPENWRPMPGRDATGRGWTQGGAGEYPLSEPETRSLVIWLLEHPNVGVANSMDTSVPMHLRGPSTSPSDERMYPEDLELLRYFDRQGLEITGYGRAGDTYQDYGGGRPLFGHGPDFGYWYYGSVWYGDELWDGGRFVGDYNDDGDDDELDNLLYNDRELERSRFQPWTKTMHPVYGEVEVGGWDPKFWRQNPPPDILEEWARKEALFNLMLASNMPQIDISEPAITADGDGRYTIAFTLENKGRIPTALLQAQLVKMVRPDTVSLEFAEGTRVIGGGGRGGRGGRGRGGRGGRGGGGRGRGGRGGVQEVETTPDSPFVRMLGDRSIDLDRILGLESREVSFSVELGGGMERATATIRFNSTRGGVRTRTFTIGGEK